MQSGIYSIRNNVTQKIYVGSSKTVKKRWWAHKDSLNKGTHINKHLQAAWNLYGSDNFVFEVLEYCAINDLVDREQFWMDTYQAYDKRFGYNLRSKAESNRGYKYPPGTGGRGKWSQESKEKVSKTRLGVKRPDVGRALRGRRKPTQFRPVEQYRDGILVREWPSATDAQEALGILKTNIGAAAMGKRSSAGGYQWKFKLDEHDHHQQSR